MKALVAAYIILTLAAVTGYVMNVIAVINGLDGGLTAMFLARLLGIFLPPFGGILGWF